MLEPLKWQMGPRPQGEFPEEQIYGHSAHLVGSRLWVLGGVHSSNRRCAVFSYDGQTGEWRDCTHEAQPDRRGPCCRWGHASCLLPEDGAGQQIFFLGGFDSECNHHDVHVFDARHGLWNTNFRPDRKGVDTYGAYHAAAAVNEAQVLVFGGMCCVGGPYKFYGGPYIYNLMERSWKKKKTSGNAPSPRAQCSMCIKDGRCFVYGGCDERHIFNDVHVLNLSSPEWRWERLHTTGCGPPAHRGNFAGDFRVTSCRCSLVVLGGTLFLLAEDREPASDRRVRRPKTRLATYILDVQQCVWHLPAQSRALAWRGNFAAVAAPADCPSSFWLIGGHDYDGSQEPGRIEILSLRSQLPWQHRRLLWMSSYLRHGRRLNPGSLAPLPNEAIAKILSFFCGRLDALVAAEML